MALLFHHNPLIPHYFSFCSISVAQGITPDNFDSPCLKLVRAAGGAAHDWHGDGRRTSKPAVLITRPSAAPRLPHRWNFDCNLSWCSTSGFYLCGISTYCSSLCNNISIWSSQKVTVADSRYDPLMVVAENTTWSTESYTELVCWLTAKTHWHFVHSSMG